MAKPSFRRTGCIGIIAGLVMSGGYVFLLILAVFASRYGYYFENDYVSSPTTQLAIIFYLCQVGGLALLSLICLQPRRFWKVALAVLLTTPVSLGLAYIFPALQHPVILPFLCYALVGTVLGFSVSGWRGAGLFAFISPILYFLAALADAAINVSEIVGFLLPGYVPYTQAHIFNESVARGSAGQISINIIYALLMAFAVTVTARVRLASSRSLTESTSFHLPRGTTGQGRNAIRKCETCDRRMRRLEAGEGSVRLSFDEMAASVGVAEECRECGRLYCDKCYPFRPKNTCVCGRGRDKVWREHGRIFTGSMRLVKVEYIGEGSLIPTTPLQLKNGEIHTPDDGSITEPISAELQSLLEMISGLLHTQDNAPVLVQLCRRALSFTDCAKDPLLWATLQATIGTGLVQLAVPTLASRVFRLTPHDEVARTTVDEQAENLEQAISAFHQALQVFTQEDNPLEWANTMNSLGVAYWGRIGGNRVENMEQAIVAHRQALQVFTQQETPLEWAQTITNLGNAYIDRIEGTRAENIEQGIAAYQQALQVFTQQATPLEWAQALNNLADAYLKRIQGERAGNTERSIDACRQALQVRTREAMPFEWAQTMNNLANAYSFRIRGDRAENIEQAITAYEQVVEVYTLQTTPIDWAQAKINLGIAYSGRVHGSQAENLEKAILAYQEALEVITPQLMPVRWAQTMDNLASIFAHRLEGDTAENIEQAIVTYQQALQIRTRQAMPFEWAQTKYNLGITYPNRLRGNRAENIEFAIDMLKESIQVRTLVSYPYYHCQTQRHLGNLYFDEGRWIQAVDAYRGALNAGDLLYQAAATPEARQVELHEIRDLPARLAYALAKATGSQQAGAVQEAVVVLEQNRARWLSEALALQSEKPPTVPEDTWQIFIAQRETVQHLQAESRLPEGTPAKRDFLTLSEALKAAWEALNTTVAQIRHYDETFMPVSTFAQVRSAAVPNYPLVYYAITTVGTLMLVVTSPSISPASGACQVHPVWGDLTEDDLDALLIQQDGQEHTGYLPAQLGLTSMGASLKGILSLLGTRLMTPLAQTLRQLGATGVVLIPGGLLNLLPLGAAFIDGRTSPGKRHAFLDEFDIAYAPSAQALAHSRHQLTHLDLDPQQATLVAVGGPSHTDTHRLPSAGAEVEDITPYFPSTRQRLLYENRATRTAILTAAPSATVLHFACHGRFDTDNPLDSALLLAGDDQLSLRDILGELHLENTRLAVLSACQTAITDFQDLPDEVIGLPAGFLAAGVPGVVGSLWPVADISTALFMERFYYFFRQENQPPAAALRAAQRWLRDVTSKELSEMFQAREEAAPDRPRMSYALAHERFVKHATRNPRGKPFASSRYWAAFTFHGV